MKKIDKYILSEMKFPIIFGISLFTFIFLIDILTQMAELLVVKSVPFLEIMTLFSYYLPNIIVQTIPMGVFLGVMITYGSLSSTSEIVAMKACGMGINKLLKMPIFIGVLVTIITYAFQEKVAPVAYRKSNILTRKIAYTRPSVGFEEKQFIEIGENYNVYIGELDDKDKKPKDLFIFARNENNSYPTIMLADTLEIIGSELSIDNIKFYELDNTGKKTLNGSFVQRIMPFNTFYGDFQTGNDAIDSLGLAQLRDEIEKRKSEGLIYLQYEIRFFQKLYIPMSAIIFCILGVLLSTSHARTGKGASFGISIFIIAAYMITMGFIKTIVEKGQVPPYIMLFLPNLVLIIVTIIFYISKTRRS